MDWAPADLVNAKDLDGDTPLFLAFENNSVDCVRIILRRAPVLETVDKKGWTLLLHAVKMGDKVCVNLVMSVPGPDLAARSAPRADIN